MEVRRDQRKAVYNFSVHDLVCRNHIDRSGPPAGETRTSTTSRHLKANIYSENMTNAKTLPFSGFYDDQKFYSVVSPANVVILVNDHHFASFLLLASTRTCKNRMCFSHELFGAFLSVI